MIWVLFLVVAVGLVAVFAALVAGRLRYDPLSDAVTSQHDPGLPEAPHARDVDGVRFDRALRGYRMDQVDEVLDTLRDTLARQEQTISALRQGEPALDAGGEGTAYRPEPPSEPEPSEPPQPSEPSQNRPDLQETPADPRPERAE